MKLLAQSIRALLVLTLVTGVLYPLLVTGLAQAFFPWQAGGSLERAGGQVIGSALLSQKFESPRYFRPRPSGGDFATVASGASNKGPTSEDLRKAVAERRKFFGPDAPSDLLTASGSGLDPHLSVEGVKYQARSVAEARQVPVEQVLALIDRLREEPQLGFLGEPRVNVLRLNHALDDAR